MSFSGQMRNFQIIVLALFALTIIFYIVHQNTYQKSMLKDIQNSKLIKKPNPLYIAVVACGQRLQETLAMIKSALLFNQYREYLFFFIFAEENLKMSFTEKLNDWRDMQTEFFNYKMMPLCFPTQNKTEWKNLFKPCAAQRLFLPSILDYVDSLLYVDTDILFLSPVTDIWHFFEKFNETQIAALAPEHIDENIGWYNRFARHPYYGRLGVNSGVMLMNLTRMRQFRWEKHVLPIHEEYKLRITWGDQDIINILFYYYPEKLYVMPCEYNYRPDHCMYMSICNASQNGIKIIHGNRGYFHSNKQPLFQTIYNAIEFYQLRDNAYENFLLPLETNLNKQVVSESSCGKMATEALHDAKQLFKNE